MQDQTAVTNESSCNMLLSNQLETEKRRPKTGFDWYRIILMHFHTYLNCYSCNYWFPSETNIIRCRYYFWHCQLIKCTEKHILKCRVIVSSKWRWLKAESTSEMTLKGLNRRWKKIENAYTWNANTWDYVVNLFNHN